MNNRLVLLAALAAIGCGSSRASEEAAPTRTDRLCEVVLDEPLPTSSGSLTLAQSAAGEVFVHENGRLLQRTATGWIELGSLPSGTGGSQFAVSPGGVQAVLADNYTEMMLWTRAPGQSWQRSFVFNEHDAIGDRALAFAGDDTLYVTVRRRYYEVELYRLRVTSGAVEKLALSGESARMTLWVESPAHWWWAYWNDGDGLVVHHGDREAVIPPDDGSGPANVGLRSARGLGVAEWNEVAAYELPSGAWTPPSRRAPSRRSECPDHDRYDDSIEGATCPIDDDIFNVRHVGGDALDLIGTERTETGSAEWRCNLEQHDGSCDWFKETENHRYLVAGRSNGSFERLLELEDARYLSFAAERGRDGDVHLVLSLEVGAAESARYLELACRDAD